MTDMRSLLSFGRSSGTTDKFRYPKLESVVWRADPWSPFRMTGLVVWGTDANSTIVSLRHGARILVDGVPASLFEGQLDFKALLEAAENHRKAQPDPVEVPKGLTNVSRHVESPYFDHGALFLEVSGQCDGAIAFGKLRIDDGVTTNKDRRRVPLSATHLWFAFRAAVTSNQPELGARFFELLKHHREQAPDDHSPTRRDDLYPETPVELWLAQHEFEWLVAHQVPSTARELFLSW